MRFASGWSSLLTKRNDPSRKYHRKEVTLQHITTDLNYVGQDELDANEGLINFKNGLLHVTERDVNLIPHIQRKGISHRDCRIRCKLLECHERYSARIR